MRDTLVHVQYVHIQSESGDMLVVGVPNLCVEELFDSLIQRLPHEPGGYLLLAHEAEQIPFVLPQPSGMHAQLRDEDRLVPNVLHTGIRGQPVPLHPVALQHGVEEMPPGGQFRTEFIHCLPHQASRSQTRTHMPTVSMFEYLAFKPTS